MLRMILTKVTHMSAAPKPCSRYISMIVIPAKSQLVIASKGPHV